MHDDRPSRTAGVVALRRAAHQVLDRPPVFVDPLARAVLSEEARSLLDSDPRHANEGKLRSRMRAFLAVRSRVAEDQLASAVQAGVQQYVVLGAGLDTFSCRNPYPDLRVFEVDHPRTQEWKRRRLMDAGLDASTAAFVPVDFTTQNLRVELAVSGFNAARPTAISWLGVLPYLEQNAIGKTLEWAASVVGESGHIVFDYGAKVKWWDFLARYGQVRLSKRVARAGEPFRTILSPEQLRNQLETFGFTNIIDMDSAELNRRYFKNRSDGLKVGGGGHVVVASRSMGPLARSRSAEHTLPHANPF